MDIEIVDFTRNMDSKSPNILAEFAVVFRFKDWNLKICRFRQIKSKKGGVFVVFPSYSIKHEVGGWVNHALIEMPMQKGIELKQKIEELLKREGQSPPIP